MAEPFGHLRKVPQELLAQRIESVKTLSGGPDEAEWYEIVKDHATGEHYLHYAYLHIHVAEGSEQSYHHLLPLSHDDVLGLMFNGEPYAYPDHWRKPFLRNGPEGYYIWFDPSDTIAGAEEENERKAGELAELLKSWKKEGRFDEQSVKQLLDQIDRTLLDDRDRN